MCGVVALTLVTLIQSQWAVCILVIILYVLVRNFPSYTIILGDNSSN